MKQECSCAVQHVSNEIIFKLLGSCPVMIYL